VYRRQNITPWLQLRRPQDLAPDLGRARVIERGIEHDVADPVNCLPSYPFCFEEADRIRGRGKKNVCKMIRNYPVDLLWHSPIKRAQPRFDMRYRHLKLCRGQSARERGIGVAIHEHAIRPLLLKDHSRAASISPVCLPWEAEPIPRL